MDPQWPEEMDRQFSVVRHLDHLGARSRRQPSQGVYRREQDHTRLQGRKNPEQDRPQGRAERPDHDGELPHSGGKPPAADESFRDTARVLKMTRFMVGWEATGCAMGAYENAVKYCQERLQ